MAGDDKSLQALDALMNEFYSPSTSNERKREIEQLLNDFKGQQDSWKYCLNFFTNTSNEYVLMYCLTVLENVINKKWIGMCGEDKSEIRLRLYGLLLSQYPRVPNFISNKLGKLIVDVGCLDWPHFYPDFFGNILQLSQSNDTSFLGLMLIQTTYEELTSPREDLSMGRKEELRRLLLEQVPPVLNILSGHLEAVLEKHNHLVTATPPPSPTHYLTGSPQNLFSTSPLHTGSILSGMLKTSSKRAFEHLPSLDAVSHQLCFLSLRCLSHLLSWIPLSSFVSSPLLSTVFHFASFGCEPDSTETYAEDVNAHCWPVKRNSQLGIQAMGCVNEIMSRTFIPSDFEEFFLQIFEDTFHLLQRLTKDCDSTKIISSNRNRLYDIDEMYIEKFTDFLHLFVGLHLKRFESSIQFPVLEFLALLFKYTFMQPSYDGFYSCLDIWNIFLVYLSSKLGSRSSEISYTISKYREALLALVQEMCRKLQFRYNQSNLEELDDEHLDDDSETEWQHFLRCSLEIISKVAEVLPEEVFNFIYSIFEENLGIYFDLENYVKVSEFGQAHLFITGENECRRLHCSIRDLSSMLQAMGCIVEQMYGNKFAEQKNMAEKLLERLCHMVTYSNKMRFYDMKTAAPLVLRMDFIEVHAQALATLKAFCPWLNQHLRDAKGFTDQRCFNSIEKVITEVTVRNIVCKIPHKVVHSASHLLLSITSSVRPTFLMMMSGFQKMVTAACEGKLQVLSLETQFVVYRSISNVFILPWPSLPDAQQDWSRRSSQHDTFVQALSAPMKSANENPMFAQDKRLHFQAKPIILWTLQVQRDLLDNIADCSMRTKQIFYQSFQPILPIIQNLFQLYLNYSDPSEIANYTPTDVSENILDLYLCLFSSLRVQVGPLFIQDTIQHFLSVFSRDQLIKIILYDTSGCKVIEKLLQLLQQVVQEPNSSFRAFLPSTISLCMDQIYPMIAEKQSTDVKAAVFDLVHQILLYNWRYFFKTNVVASLGQSGNEIVENEQDFAKIMEAFGQSFFQSDLRIFRQNLNALESLNSKWRLYHKGVFKSMMLNHFLDVLLRTLINKSHNLLQEEIILTIYNMASVHFNNFYSAYLHQFLTKSEGLDANQKLSLLQNFEQETDYPSFTQNIQRFVSDFRYYCVCNSAIPQR